MVLSHGSLVHLKIDGHVASVTLDDPDRRNALGIPMFDALAEKLKTIRSDSGIHVVLLCGRGEAFCSGFDITAALDDHALLGQFIERLSLLLRTLRRLPQVVVAAVQGAAIAGGCAIVSACDLVVVSATARLGYPVHRIGLSPAVTIATLQQAIGPGAARATLLGGQLFDGANACRIGLAARLCPDDASVHTEAIRLCRSIAAHGPQALRATKRWLNELDGSLDDERFDRPAQDSAATCTEEARAMLARQVRKNLDGRHS